MAPDHRAVKFETHHDVPVDSHGYFSADGSTTIDAAKVLLGGEPVWLKGDWRRAERFEPEGHWAFTSTSGPANDEALLSNERDRLLAESLGITSQQAGIVSSALWDKAADQSRYVSGMDKDPQPNPVDCCPSCDLENERAAEMVDQRKRLKAFKKEIERLARLFERIADKGLGAIPPQSTEDSDD